MEFFGKMFEIIKEWYGYHSGLEESIQNLKRKMEYLSAQANDINEQISSDRPWKKRKTEVEVWLRDEQLMKNDVRRLEQEVVGERSIFSRARLGSRIIKKTQEVEKLQEKGRAIDGLLVDDFPTGGLLMPPTKDFVESTEARNTERVWECVMNEGVRQIGVYGMGGVGKTTIMKHIRNRILKEAGKFDNVYWVTVSKAFNIPKLQSDIAKVLNLRLSNDEDETIRASELYAALSRKKKYVLILDDLWEAFPLERVGILEPTQFNGCKIVLTTRSLDVCRRMDCTAVKVELLTEQEAQTLFLRKAIRNDVVLAPEVEATAAKIAKKCARLPLAIVTVAGSLRGVEGTHEWRDALNEFTKSRNEVSGGESKVFEQLKFSYSRLGDKVVQDCFLYCSLYPEDYDIFEEELIELWIAEGLVPEMNSVEAMDDKGRSILEKLKSTCLLESTIDDGGCERVRMHDLIRDMAFRIIGGRYRFIEEDEEGLWSEDHEKISFMFQDVCPNYRPPVCPRLTSLLWTCPNLCLIPDSFFINMPCLKVLDLSFTKIQSLPESISNLENLHALLMDSCKQLEYVPSLEKLKALKMFILTSSLIKEAPIGLEQLVNLRKLDLASNRTLEFPSTKLRGLSKLQWLLLGSTRVKVSTEDLTCLSQLKVVEVQFHNVQELTRYVISQQFQGLEKYHLGMGETLKHHLYAKKGVVINIESKPFRSGVDQLVLPKDVSGFVLRGYHDLSSLSSMPSLKDVRSLSKCDVECCDGLESIFSSSSFSEDGQISLSSISFLSLLDLPSCRVLFDGISSAHGISFNLTALSITKCHSMKYILPAQLLQNLPNLETLKVKCCDSVEEIIVGEEGMNDSHHRDNSNAITFPRLKLLILDSLPTLKSIHSGTFVSESDFDIHVERCPMLRRLPLSLHMDNEQASAPPSLHCILGDGEWWESLEWDDPRTKTTLQPFFWDGTDESEDSDSIDLNKLYDRSADDPLVSDATFSIPDLGSNSGTAPEGGVLYMEESVRLNEMGEVATQGLKLSPEVSYSSEEELLEQMWLEELEETPSDPGELEDLNCDPMEVPPTISHHFSILHILDLSYTEINSLPQSISRLVALQKLFLRSCDLLHELPPEIGELSNLQVLDLEGTEILCLPKEIAKLVNLTCLKVSFYGYANKTVIPRRVLSNLSRLNELIIHVTPYGEWWDVEVEAIIDDLCSLDELRALKLYLPTAELLEGLTRIFSRLANFRFTVGRHEEHFISRLPRDVEEEFNNQEKLEKGLNYINGSSIPNEIAKVFKHASAFFLQRHWTAKSLSEFGHENMNEVKFCLVMECNEFRTIIDSEQFYQGKDGRSESEDFMDIDENIVLGSLQKMIIRYMKNMASIWNGPVGKGSLSNLKSLALHTCPNLATVFTIDMLNNLINLEELTVEDCPKIDSLVSLKSSNSKSGLFLPNLKKISLLELPELVSISSGLWIAPILEKMVIFYCPKLEKLSTMDVSSTNLKVIKGEKEWWDALKWYESDLSTEQEDFLTSLFIPLRRDGDLMAQLTKD